jgi:hypothetical protein
VKLKDCRSRNSSRQHYLREAAQTRNRGAIRALCHRLIPLETEAVEDYTLPRRQPLRALWFPDRQFERSGCNTGFLLDLTAWRK